MRKTFKNYELMLGEIVTYYQLIERDLKLIYLFYLILEIELDIQLKILILKV